MGKDMITLKNRYISLSSEETEEIGRIIAKTNNRTIGLIGELGSGKTVFAKGFFSELGILKKDVTSPSYIIVNEYRKKEHLFYHIDLYRYRNFEDDFGFWEIMEKGQKIVIEWADRLGDDVDCLDLLIFFEISENQRIIKITKKT
jgi:tRNA threonylcarbamoyladenosine biosynthesis protein TsaE